MNLFDKYAKEIRSWNWANVKAQALQNVETDECGEKVGRCFLGSIMALTPSGKIYTPFANSNVDSCPVCHGAGSVKNHKASAEMHETFKARAFALRGQLLSEHGAWCNGAWPKYQVAQLAVLDKNVEATADTKTCQRCGGLGSHEAYQDQCFNEALEKVAEEHGMWIEYDDDVFAGISIDSDEEPEEVEEESEA